MLPERDYIKQQKQIYNLVVNMTNSGQKQIEALYKDSLDSIKLELLDLVERYGDNGTLTKAEMTRYNRMKNLHDSIQQEIKKLTGNYYQFLTGLEKEVYNETFFRNFYLIENEIGIATQFGGLNTKAVQAAITEPLPGVKLTDIVKNLGNVTAQGVQNAIATGIIQGWSIPKFTKAIKKQMGISNARAAKIARTETLRAFSKSDEIVYQRSKQIGISLVKIWLASLNERTRIKHQEADGLEADENGIFTLPDGTKTIGPRLTGIAEHDINCRCTIIYKIAGISGQLEKRRAKGEGIINYTTYENWKKSKNVA